jgi:hypothetical protein
MAEPLTVMHDGLQILPMLIGLKSRIARSRKPPKTLLKDVMETLNEIVPTDADKFYAIVTSERIGKTSGEGVPDALSSEPDCTFEEITRVEYDNDKEA